MLAISSGSCSAEPQSPAVIVARWIDQPCSLRSRTNVPAQRNSASSGCARTAIAVRFIAGLGASPGERAGRIAIRLTRDRLERADGSLGGASLLGALRIAVFGLEVCYIPPALDAELNADRIL